MAQMTFYFYDLETSGGSPKTARIMQFAGQRTDDNLEPIGEPDNVLIKLSDDVIPDPDAILVHGITPQKTLEEGLTEAEFTKFFHEKISNPGTVFVGFNSVRFDDEFTRRICYRTFYDPYQWHWKDGRGRWDLLDPIRMMRALRPDGLKWPMLDGRPTVKLELMAQENSISHENAHDALGDVIALLELAKRFKKSQPKLFDYLVSIRDKKSVAQLVEGGQPFVYTSGRYSSGHEKTTVVHTLFKHPRRDSAIVYDLRENPTKWLKKTPEELVTHWQARFKDDIEKLPAKTLKYNRCPAIAPLGVLDQKAKERIAVDMPTIKKHRSILIKNQQFVENLRKALDILEDEQQTRLQLDDSADNKIYDGFWTDKDQTELRAIRSSAPEELSGLVAATKNVRIRELIPLYKARNFPKLLNQQEREDWEAYRRKYFYNKGDSSRITKFSKRIADIVKNRKLTKNEEYLLTELQLYVESILPEQEDSDSQLT